MCSSVPGMRYVTCMPLATTDAVCESGYVASDVSRRSARASYATRPLSRPRDGLNHEHVPHAPTARVWVRAINGEQQVATWVRPLISRPQSRPTCTVRHSGSGAISTKNSIALSQHIATLPPNARPPAQNVMSASHSTIAELCSATTVAKRGVWYAVVTDGRKRGYYDFRPARS